MKTRLAKGLSLFVNMTPEKWIKPLCGEITPIFYLHRLYHESEPEQERFIAHLEWCLSYIRKNGYYPISLHELSQAYKNGTAVKPKSVVFTLDDGFRDQYELALPVFNRFDVPYTCFIVTDFIDEKLWPWDDQLKFIINQTKKPELNITLPNGEPLSLDIRLNGPRINRQKLRLEIKKLEQDNLYAWLDELYEQAEVVKPTEIPEDFQPMSWEQAQDLITQGHDIAPHTLSHRILSKLSDDNARQEIVGSFERVREKLLGSRNLFAYPTGRLGDFTSREYQYLSEAGVDHAVTTREDHSMPTQQPFELPRFVLPENRFDFIQYLSYIEALKSRFFS